MKKVLFLLALCSAISCDDGDIIVTELDFEDQTLERCDDFDFLFYKVNPDSNESIAIQFSTNEDILGEIGEVALALEGENAIVYRKFDDVVTNAYFCNPIPPTSPEVTDELTSFSGMVTITTTADQEDNDGIPTQVEDPTGLLDTDQDLLLDIYDDDDDGDNIPTIFELGTTTTDANGNIDLTTARDSDGDGTPDYLDPDDDNDGVLTINEDANSDLDPRTDDSNPNTDEPDYLDPSFPPDGIALVNIEEYRPHSYDLINVQVEIIVNTVQFIDENGEPVLSFVDDIVNFGAYNAADIPIIITPVFVD